jgi:hypothetical protein
MHPVWWWVLGFVSFPALIILVCLILDAFSWKRPWHRTRDDPPPETPPQEIPRGPVPQDDWTVVKKLNRPRTMWDKD